MGYPLRQDVPDPRSDEPYKSEVILRPALDADGRVKVLQLPPTRENLLDPRVEDKVTQNNPHARLLSPLAVALRAELEEREDGNYGVFEDLLLVLKHHPGFDHDSGPDVVVVRGIDDPEKVNESLDVIAEGLGVALAIEVVSTKYKDSRDKDEVDNVPVYDRLGVENYVMVYPRVEERGEDLRLVAMTRSPSGGRGGRHGGLVDNPPNPQGRIRIRSLDLWIFIDDEKRLALEDVKTGKRIWFHVDERRLRRLAEQRAEEQERRAEQEAKTRRDAERRAEEHERRAEQEAKTRRDAERRAEEHERRAEEQKRRAEQEARARRDAERRIQEQERRIEEQGAEARRQAEHQAEIVARRQAVETLVMILESRGLAVTDEDRRRILDCRDLETLRRWTLAAVGVSSPGDLWDDP